MSQFVRLLRSVGLAVVGIVSLGIGTIVMHAPHTHSASGDQLVAYSTPFYGAFGNAGSLPPPSSPLSSVVTATAVTSSGTGVLAVTADGHVVPSGSATSYGDASALNLYAPIVGIALTPDDHGYWLVASDGGVFSFGDAAFYGSMGGHPLNAPVVGIAATPTGHGYWLVAADGGIFTFGDAPFYGSMGGQHLNAGVVGMAATPTGQGYWLVASDGGIFTFGDAPFYGSMGGQPLNASVMGMAVTPNGEGYWLVGNDGGVFTFGNAPFYGSDGAMLPNAVISGIMAAPNGAGYWLVSPDSATYGFTPTPDERILPASAGVAAAAASQIGPATSGGFCNPYGPCEEWCAYFASWTWNQAGVPSVSDGFTGDLYQWAATHTGVLGPSAMPAEGDIVFYGTGPQNTGTSVHAGVVMQTWPDGSLVTIEGDSGPGPAGWLGVTINGPYLAARSVESNGDPIYGFGEP